MKQRFYLLFVMVVILLSISACKKEVEGQVPVYQGMSISTTEIFQETNFSRDILTDLTLNSPSNLSINDLIEDEVLIEDSNDVEYYALKNQDIFIRVKILNPDKQVILRFTLNGVVYQSFQFQDGSDSENLILKINAGNESGIKTYTIDEIKYIENSSNETKDVIFDGNRSVKLGVTHSTIPSATVTNKDIRATSVLFTASISDVDGLIESSGSILKAYLYDGSEIVQKIDINVGNNFVKFDKLNTDSNYEYALITVVDSLDGTGSRVLVLKQENLTTEKIITFGSTSSTQNSLSFNLVVNDEDNVGEIYEIKLLKGNVEIASSIDTTTRTFDNLDPVSLYTLIVSYKYQFSDSTNEFFYQNTIEISTLGYTITFNYDSVNTHAEVQYKYNQTFKLPNNPVKKGHSFIGWTESIDGSEKYNFSNSLKEDIILYPIWNINSYQVKVYQQKDIIFNQIYSGQFHFVGVSIDNRVFAWGSNQFNQLGVPITGLEQFDAVEISHFFELNENESIKSLALGAYHSLLLTSEGRLYSWGSNQYGQLATNLRDETLSPIEVTDNFNLSANEKIEIISAGLYHNIALTSESRVFVWGDNQYGQLSNETNQIIRQPIDITSQFMVNNDESIVKIHANSNSNYALLNSNKLYAIGDVLSKISLFHPIGHENYWVPTNITNIFDLQEGELINDLYGNHHRIIITTSSNRVISLGEWPFQDWDGYTGAADYALYGDLNGDAYYDLTHLYDFQFDEIILDVAVGYNFHHVITNQRLIAYGVNWSGQLGDGTVNNAKIPLDIDIDQIEEDYGQILKITASSYAASAITLNGKVLTWGSGYEIARNPKILVSRDGTHVISSGSCPNNCILNVDITKDIHSIIDEEISIISEGMLLTVSGSVFTWGRNIYGEVGNGTYANQLLPINITNLFNLHEDEQIISVKSSYDSISKIALTSKGRVFTWGYAAQTGANAWDDINVPTDITSSFNLEENDSIIQIEAGGSHMAALSGQGRLFMWGQNSENQLGDGTNISRYSPIEITNKFNLSQESIVSVILGDSFSYAITSSNKLFAWGWNYYGRLAFPSSTEYVNLPTNITSILNLPNGTNIKDIKAGSHTMLLTDNDELYAWGPNEQGQLGLGYKNQAMYSPTKIDLTEYLLANESISSLYTFGANTYLFTNQMRIIGWGINLADGEFRPRVMNQYLYMEQGDEVHQIYPHGHSLIVTTIYNQVYVLPQPNSYSYLPIWSVAKPFEMILGYDIEIFDVTFDEDLVSYFDGYFSNGILYLDKNYMTEMIIDLMPDYNLIVYVSVESINTN